jgi:hypothetical protein
MLRIILKSVLATLSLTLMLLAVVYTAQSREQRENAPKRIGETRTQAPFLVDYAATRQQLLMGYLRETFPALNLPEAEAPPEDPLSLKALHARTHASQSPRLTGQ